MFTAKFIFLMLLAACALTLSSGGFTTEEQRNYEWKISFEDNFDSFDLTKWRTLHDNGNRTIWSNKELQWYADENVTSDNGTLKLKVSKQRVFGKDVESEKYFDFTSGMICNSKSHSQAYGKWEMRVKFPFKRGFWPAFYLVPLQRPTLPEIDIFEYFGIDKNKISCSHHWGIDYTSIGEPFYYMKTKELEGNYDNRWMVWSFECFPDKMIWYLDGNKVYESSQGVPTAPLYMIANVAVLDREQNDYQVDSSDLPYVMEIDYVKIYKMVPKN